MALTLLKGVIVLGIITGTLAGPMRYDDLEPTNECATTCDLSETAKYTPGQTYEYDFQSKIVTSIPGATEEESRLKMSAQVQLEALTPCELAIRLTDVSLEDSAPNGENYVFVDRAMEFKRALQDKPLRFAFQNGKVESVCPEEGEETWVLNVKRGIISHIQNTMPDTGSNIRLRETDINGDCEVSYEVIKRGWGSNTVKKSADLIGCVGRQSFDTVLQGTPYRVPSRLQSLPLLKSSHECEQTLAGEGHASSVTCNEKHIFRPFSSESSGAMTEVISTLTLSKTTSAISVQKGRVSRHESLVFENKPGPAEQEQSRREVKETMQKLCDQTKEDIRPETPSLYHAMVRQMRKLDTDSLNAIHRLVTEGRMCQKAEKFFRDAIPVIQSPASVSFIRDLVKSGEVKDTELDVWMTSMAFISKPSIEMLEAVKPLVEMDEPNRKVAMAVSSLVHSYCRENAECGEKSIVKEIISIFQENLRYNCKTNNEKQYEKVMMSLKAIGNTGHAESAVDNLNNCISSEENPMEIRVAAISAFRRMACTAEKYELMRLFEDTHKDSELRIGAYLAMMHCPTNDILARVRSSLEKEEINQVGSFVWTHLTNLAESSCPLKQEIREILENAELKKEFDMDKRKFSRNIEWSLFSEMLNTGALVESNLIWSTKSFIPRSANLNLTVDVFGESVNLLEVGGRAEGLDSILEKIFNKEDNTVERGKRDIIKKNAINRLDTQYKPDGPDSPQGSYFIRVFGNEIRYDDFRSLDLESFKSKFDYLEWLIELSREHDFDFTKSISFLDTTMSIPTMAGLPLTLSVDGTAVIDVKVKGKLDLRNLGIAPRSVDIVGSVAPSAAIEITGEMGVDAFVTRTGLRRTSTLHSSTIADGKIELKEGKIFNMDINMPREKVELLDAKTKFYIHYRGEDREQKMPSVPRISASKCIAGNLVRAAGVQVCASGSMPSFKENEWWMSIFGPMEANIVVEKKDTFTGMHFEAKFLEDRVIREQGAEITDIMKISFNTPGSRYDREFTLDFTLNRNQRAVKLNMRTPWKKADLTGSLVNQEDLKRFTARAIVDDEKEYALTAEIQVEANKYNTKYIPVVELTVPTRTVGRLEGEVTYRPNKKIDIDLSIKELTRSPMSIKGGILVKDKGLRHDIDMAVKVPGFSGDVEGFLERSPESSLSSRMTVNYQIARGPRESFTITKKWSKTSNGDLDEYSINGGISTSRWPEYNSDVQMTFSKTGWKSISLALEGGLGESSANRMTMTASATDNSRNKKKAYEGFMRFKLPVKNMAYEASFQHAHSDTDLKTKGSVKYGQRQEAVLDISAKKESTSPLKMNAQGTLHYPGREFRYSQSVEEKASKEYHHDLEITLAKFQKIGITSVYKMEPRHELTATVNLPSLKPIILEGHLNPDIKNLQSHALVQYEDKKWGGDASVSYDWNKKDGNMRSGIDIIYPSRHIKAETEATRSGKVASGRMEILWDADRDTSMKIDTTAEIVLNAAAPRIELKTTWPNNFIEITARGKNDKKGWWAVERDLEGLIKLKSSIAPLEDISLSFSHDQTDDMVKSHVESTWAPGKTINGDFQLNKVKGWSAVDTTLTARTPFYGYRTIEGKVNYKKQGSSIDGKASAKWESKEISLAASGSANWQNHDLKGSVSLSSPFRGYEQITLDGSHRDDSKIYNSQLTANWGAGKTAGLVFNMDHSRLGWSVSNNGDFAVTTPFSGYESNKIIWTHQNDADSIKTHVEGEMAGGRSILDVDANHKSNRNKRAIDMTASLRTPFKHARDMRLNFNHQNDKSSWENIKTSAMAQWAPGKAVQIENTAGYTAGRSVTKNMKITTPFRGYELITIDVDNRINGDTFTSHKEIKWGNNKKITIDGSMTRNGYEFDTELRFTSPYQSVERLVFQASNKKENSIWVSSASFDYAPEKKMELTTKVGIETEKKLSVIFKTPCPYFKEFLVDLDHSGVWRDFNTKAEIKYDPYFDPITATIKFDAANLKSIKAKVDIETPFRSTRSISALLSHKKTGRFNYKSYASFEMPRHKVSASHDMILKSIEDYSCHSEVEYNQEKLGELDVSWEFEPKFSTKVNGKIYFSSVAPAGIMVSHEGDLYDHKNEIAIEWENKKINAGTELKLEERSLMANAKIETPFATLRNVDVTLKHNGDWSRFNNDASIEVNGKRSTFTSEASYDGKQVEGRLEINNPYSYIPATIMVTFNHQGKWKNFRNTASVEWGTRRIGASSEFSLKGTDLRGRITLQIPEDYSVIVNHNGDWTDFNNDAVVRLNTKEIRGSSAFKLNGNHMETAVNIRTPYKEFRNLGIEATHDGPLDNFKTEAKVKTPFNVLPTADMSVSHSGSLYDFQNSFSLDLSGKRFAGNSRYSKIGSNIDASGAVETPYADYDKFSYSVNHQGEPRDFSTTIGIETPFRNFRRSSVNLNHKGNLKNFDSSARIETSYPGWDSAAVSAKHVTTRQGFKSSGSIETPFKNYKKMEGKLIHRGGWGDFSTSGNVETTIPGYEKFEGSLTHNCDSSKSETSAKVETPFPGYEKFEANLNHEGSLKEFTTSGQLKTSVNGYERFGINMNHKADDRGIDSSATVETPFRGYDRFMANLQHSGNRRNFQTSAAVETPISGYERFGMNVNHRGHASEFETSAGVETPFQGLNKFSGTLKHQGNLQDFETSASAETPFRGYNRLSGKVTHKGGLNDFETSGEVQTSKHRFSGNVKHSGSLSDFETSASATSSISGYESFRGSLKHRGDIQDFTTVGSLETSHPDYSRFAVNINHDMKRAVSSSGSVETPIRGYEKFDWDMNHRRNKKGFVTNAKLNTPIRGYDRFGMNIKHDGSDWRDFNTQIKAKTPIRGYESFGARVNHQGDLRDFKTSATLDTPFERAQTINLNINHQGDLSAFSTGGSVDWDGKTIEGNANMRTSGGWWQHDHTATVSLKTPWDKVRSANVKVEHNGGNGAWNGKIEGMLNDRTHVDADYSLDTGARKTLDLNVREPRPMTLNIDSDKKGASAAINWDPSRKDSKIRVEAGLKNQDKEKELKVNLELPSRTVGVLASLDKSGDKWAHKAELQWDSDPKKKLGYEIDISESSRGRQNIYDGLLKISSPRINFEVTGNHVAVPGKRYTTEVALQTRERLVIKNELTTNWPTFRNQITIMHPRFKRDAVFTTEGTVELEKLNLDGKIELRYEEESIDFTGKLADESSGYNKHYLSAMTLRHPNSQLDFSYSGSYQNSAELYSAKMETNIFCSHDRQMKTFALRSEINKPREEFKLEIQNPLIGDLSASGRRTYSDIEAGKHRFELIGAYEGRSSRVDMSVDRSEPSAELKITDHTDNTLHVYAKYLDPSHLSMKIYHTARGEDVDDAELSLRLSDGRLLRARAYLRPEIIDDIKYSARGQYDSRILEKAMRELSEEWQMKKPALAAALYPLKDAAVAVHEDVSATWEDISADAERMYRNNEFYLRDAYRVVYNAWEIVSEKVDRALSELGRHLAYYKDIAADIKARVWERMEKFKQDLHMAGGMFISGLHVSVREAAVLMSDKLSAKWEELREWTRRTSPWLGYSVERAWAKYAEWSNAVCDWVKDKMDAIRSHPTVQDMVSKISGARATLNRWKDSVSSRLDIVNDHYNEILVRAKDHWRQVKKHPHVKKAVDMAKTAWDNSQWAVKYMEVEKKARQAVDWMKDQSIETAKDKALEWTKNYLQLEKTRFTVWDPQRGDFQVEIYLPITLRDLQTLPKIDVKKYVVRARNFINKYMPDNIYVWDYYYMYMPSADYTNWVPPFKAHATLAGQQHYMTFDKHFYEFEGQCSYLLARDFIDGKFAVVVNYEPGTPTRKTISVIVGDQQVEILSGYKVLLDGQRVEMPQIFDKTTIVREDNSVIIHNRNGITVTCNLPRDRCTVDVTGWYFGKTAGLFGTYSNEAADDFTKADGNIARSPEDLAESWTVGRKCNTVNAASVVDATPDNQRYRLCASLFKEESSAFRPCFKQVDPSSFMQMCLNELPTNQNRLMEEEDMCDVASFYVEECRRAGVPIRVPASCVSCELPNGSKQPMGEDQVLEGEEIPESADVVIVMSHGTCNEELKPDLPNLIKNIDKALKEEGFENNRFALIGYGGKSLSAPHIHTIQGEIFGEESKFYLALDNFHFEDSIMEDSLAALRYVSTELRFRPAVSKNIILIPCEKCLEKSVRYSEVQDLMLRRDLALHVLMEHEFRVNAKSPKTSYIFGVDSESMFTDKDYGKLKGDTELRDFVIMPKDICVALSEETDGSVFNINKMKTGKPFIQKKFRDVFSLMVTEKAEPADCQICDCVADEVGMGKSVCRPCVIRSPIYKYLPDFGKEDEPEDDGSLSSESSEEENKIKKGPIIKPPKKTKKNKKFKKSKAKVTDKRRMRLLKRKNAKKMAS